MPQNAAGLRSEPPVSEPLASGTIPVAKRHRRAAGGAGRRARPGRTDCRWRRRRRCGCWRRRRIPACWSCRRRSPPARTDAGDAAARPAPARWSRKIGLPEVVRRPPRLSRSLMPIGSPCSGGSVVAARHRRIGLPSRRRGRGRNRARPWRSPHGPRASIRAMQLSSSSVGARRLLPISARASTAVRSQGSVAMAVAPFVISSPAPGRPCAARSRRPGSRARGRSRSPGRRHAAARPSGDRGRAAPVRPRTSAGMPRSTCSFAAGREQARQVDRLLDVEAVFQDVGQEPASGPSAGNARPSRRTASPPAPSFDQHARDDRVHRPLAGRDAVRMAALARGSRSRGSAASRRTSRPGCRNRSPRTAS